MPSTGDPIVNPYEKYGIQLNINRTQQPGQQPQPSSGGGGGGFGGTPGYMPGSMTFTNPEDASRFQQQRDNSNLQFYQQSQLAKQAQNAQFELQQAQFNQQNKMRDSLLSSLNAVGTWGTNAPPMPRIEMQQIPFQGGVPQVQQIQMPDFTAAQNAAFARAKDREGQLAQGALQGLRSTLGGRGLLGSGAEFRGTANIANRALGNMGEVNREQAIQNANASVDAMKTGYQGAITQRGQDIQQAQGLNDINFRTAQANFDAQMRQNEFAAQQNAQQQQFMQNLLLGLVRSY